MGNYRQAHELLLHSYRQKQQALAKDDPALFISQVLLGQLYYATKDYDKALQFLTNGLDAMTTADGDYTFWKADACQTLALLHDERKNDSQAALYYERADALYEESLQGEYDNIYLEFLSNAALFYAREGNTRLALTKAGKAYEYIAKTAGAESLPASLQLLNLSQVNYLAGRYGEALDYSRRSLAAMNKAIRTTTNLLDSVKTELKKPAAILQKTKAEYALLPVKDPPALSRLLVELNESLNILERRKAVLYDAGDVSLLMASQSELIRFMEKLTLELYKLTGDQTHLHRLLSLRESALYNRIRSRLSKADSVHFAHVPAAIQASEKALKAAITTSLEGDRSHNVKMASYFAATDAWSSFQEKLKNEYPRYYQLRFASIFRPLDKPQHGVPEGTTLVRYFFIDKELYALVADRQSERLISLPVTNLEELVAQLLVNAYDARKTGETLYALYRQLWAPLAGTIRHSRVVIIPDGILYNLSFETLTPKPISSFKELRTNSLLARHSIAYHYSLFLLGQKNSFSHGGSFVAFAPGFTERLKQPYRSAAGRGALPDNRYLSLLPQPFTLDLAAKAGRLFGGRAFLHEQSTTGSFIQNAGHHRIIHIGTHAESDNLHPEFSRLIFAKDRDAAGEDNYLYLPQIYQCDLTADLAVLTACESGKPGFADGEGMISLAHAFNYAGSESIITGLWKIDEQVSALLMEQVYQNLLAGMTKDEALRQAKLSYLEQAGGRALAPQFWAGLVVMGDTGPVALNASRTLAWWWSGGGVLAILFLSGLIYRRRHKKMPHRRVSL